MSQPSQPVIPPPSDLPIEIIDGVEYVRIPRSDWVPRSDWEALQAEAAALRAENAVFRERIAVLEEENRQLRAAIRAIQDKLGLNSGNSSLPPSSDRPGNKPKRKGTGKSGRKRGGQKGHKGKARILLPPEEVTHSVLCKLGMCSVCGGPMKAVDAEPVRLQKLEVPELKPEVTEYIRPIGVCEVCGQRALAPLPAGVDESLLGPRALAVISWLAGDMRMSRRRVQRLFRVLLGITVSLGTVSQAEGRVSPALALPHEHALSFVQRRPVVGADETSIPLGSRLGWLWLATSEAVSVFLVRDNRARRSALELLGEAFSGILLTDRYSAYAFFKGLRQFCLAHLKRDFGRIEDRGGEEGDIGHQLALWLRLVFAQWHRFKRGEIDREGLKRGLERHQSSIRSWLEYGVAEGSDKTARTCKNLLDGWEHLWTFISHEGVEPTNNQSEQRLRHFVCWRRSSGGPQSERGQRFIERILTVVQSCASQGRDVLDFLHQAVVAHLRGDEPPSLLPPAIFA